MVGVVADGILELFLTPVTQLQSPKSPCRSLPTPTSFPTDATNAIITARMLARMNAGECRGIISTRAVLRVL